MLLTITPELAREFLTHNTNNRKISRQVVNDYARIMAHDGWQDNGETIKFKKNGDLFDGQHRLLAIIKHGKPVKMRVEYDIDNDATICDRGKLRTASDILQMAGHKDLGTQYIAGTMKLLFRMYEKGLEKDDSVLIKFGEDYREQILTACRVANTGCCHPIGKKASCAAAAFCTLMCGVDENLLERFFTTMNTGFYDNAAQTSAIILRNMLMEMRGVNGAVHQAEIFTLTCSAIYDYAYCVPRKKRYTISTKQENRYWNYTRAHILSKYAVGNN